MSIAQKLHNILETIPKDVTLVAVSKTKPIEAIMEAYTNGHTVFGENKVQEMVEKYEQLPKDIKWHMIGHLQRNKVKYMAGFVHLIHGVDSLKLLEEINKQAMKHSRVINCLLQIKIAKEESKFGLSKEEAEDILKSKAYSEFTHVTIVGLMGMATFTNDNNIVKKEFLFLKTVFDEFQENYPELQTISMGMSGDYQLAIASGSTMVRVGSSIFGSRV